MCGLLICRIVCAAVWLFVWLMYNYITYIQSSFGCFLSFFSFINLQLDLCTLTFNTIRCSVRLYLQLFVGGLMSYLRYLFLFAYGGIHFDWPCGVLLCLFTKLKCS